MRGGHISCGTNQCRHEWRPGTHKCVRHDMMKGTMRPLILLLFTLAMGAADLSQVRTVYILPMAGGLDQHLANRITEARAFQVVTDPKRADALLTDRLGQSLEERLD